MSKQYRKKPIVIEAMQIGVNSYKDIISWSGATPVKSGNSYAFLVISTPEGDMRAETGDFVIKGVNGEFYPCKPDIFEKAYEEVTPPTEGEKRDE